MSERFEVLKGLIEFDDSLELMASKLREFSFDFSGKPYVLERHHLKKALIQVISGDKETTELVRWANLIEMREDIEFDVEHEDLIGEIMHKIANPDLEGEVNLLRCKALLAELN